MKRDLDLIRTLLLKIEEHNDPTPIYSERFYNLSDSPAIIDFHLRLLLQAGFIEAYEIPVLNKNYPQYSVLCLTFNGCDYLDSIRDESVWASIKSKLQSVSSSATFEVIKSLATSIILSKLNP